MALTWDKFNQQQTPTISKGWDAFNQKMSVKSYQDEARIHTDINTGLFVEAKKRGATTQELKTLKPKKVSFLKEFGKTAKETVGGLFGQMIRNIRGTTQALATVAFVPGAII